MSGTWDEFENHRQGAPARATGAAPSAEPQPLTDAYDEFAAMGFRLFSGGEGADWLEQLKARKFDAAISPKISNDELRFIEGQRELVREIERLIKRGREQFAARSGHP